METPPSVNVALAPVPRERGTRGDAGAPSGLPWHTLPRTSSAADDEADGPLLPELLPSSVARIADTPFDDLDARELAVLGRWLERASHRWPTRRSRRARVGSSVHRLANRDTIAAAVRSGCAPMQLKR
jgi:uncharacterized protein with von Willebrand factor type A (vWA) domain